MAVSFSRKQAQVEAGKPVTPTSLIASAVQISYDNLLSWTGYQFGRDEGWQKELWRLYDIVGEFRFASNWVGSMCGRVRIYVAEVDERGVLGPETTDPQISALADNMLGGPAAKSEALRLMGINLTVAGELFVVGKAGRGGDADKWFIVTPSEITRWRGGVYYNGAEGPVQLVDNTDMIIRVWTPHPRRVFLADSPAHGAMNIITEIERLTKFVFSQIDSRLAGAGILFIPTGMDFPDNDDGLGAADSIMAKLTEAGAASLKGEGSAAGIIPIVAEVPQEALGKIQLVRFDSVLSEQAESLRDEAIKRFAYSMDFPPEVITGQGSSNHWCCDTECLILTKDRGWVDESQLGIGDHVATLNHETGMSEWQPVLDIYRADVIDEPMLSMESTNHSSLTTGGHRWPIIKTGKKVAGSRRRWTTTVDGFMQSDRVPVASAWGATTLPTEPKYTDSLVKLLAAYMSDGTLLRNHRTDADYGHCRIAKFDQREIDDLRDILTDVFGVGGFAEHFHPTSTRDGQAFVLRGEATRMLRGMTGQDRALTIQFVNELTQAQLHLLLESMITIGDGIRSAGGYTFFQVKSHRLDAMEIAGILLGYKVTRGRRNQQTGFGSEPVYWLRLTKSRTVFTPSDAAQETVSYTGRIWCPTTANGTWLAQRNGKTFFTGNSAWYVDENAIKVHVEPLMSRICDALTTATLVPSLTKLGKDPKRFTYWYDTSGLTARPTRLEDALKLNGAQLLSGEAAVEAGFFREDEMMSDEERNRILGWQAVLRDPTLLQNDDFRIMIGIPESVIPKGALMPPAPVLPPPPPVPPKTVVQPGRQPIPDTRGQIPSQQPKSTALASSAAQSSTLALVATAELAARRAMELAGGRMLKGRHDRFPDIEKWKLNTQFNGQEDATITKLLAGAWTHVPVIASIIDTVDADQLTEVLNTYCSELLRTSTAHQPDALLDALRQAGMVDD